MKQLRYFEDQLWQGVKTRHGYPNNCSETAKCHSIATIGAAWPRQRAAPCPTERFVKAALEEGLPAT